MKKRLAIILELSKSHFLFLCVGFVFLVILARNPFSMRNLIANLEPFPDTTHYISPAISILNGEGVYISREGRKFRASVPPLYSIAIAPAIGATGDVRAFYFINVIFALLSFVLFYLITLKLFNDKKISFALLLLYLVSYPIYWYPTLAMAENMILPMFMAILYILIFPVSNTRAGIVAMLSIAFYATKYASLPLTFAIPILYAVKIIVTEKNKERWYFLLFFGITTFLFLLAFQVYEYLVKGNNVIFGLASLAFNVLVKDPIQAASDQQGGGGGGGYFNLSYAVTNFTAYFGWLTGSTRNILWAKVQLLPNYLAIPALVSMVTAIFSKNKLIRGMSSALIILLMTNIFFMLSFYAYDMRYFFIAIPSIFLAVGFLLFQIKNLRPPFKNFGLAIFGLLIVFYLISTASLFKYNLLLSIKNAESPWWYISIKVLEEHIASTGYSGQAVSLQDRPVVISAILPYIVDYYTKNDYELLPLSNDHDFRGQDVDLWGQNDYSSLIGLYEKYLKSGRKVYVNNYGLGNEKPRHADFENIKNNFEMELIGEGCYNLCNTWELHLPADFPK